MSKPGLPRVLALATIVVLVVVLGLAGVSASGRASPIVLGSKHFAGSLGKGFGTVKPRKIFNGGD